MCDNLLGSLSNSLIGSAYGPQTPTIDVWSKRVVIMENLSHPPIIRVFGLLLSKVVKNQFLPYKQNRVREAVKSCNERLTTSDQRAECL